MTISPYFLPLSKPFLFIFPHIQPFTLSFSTHILYSSLPCSTAPMPDQCIYTLTVVPTLHQQIHIQSLLFFPSIWWPPCFLPPSYIPWLVSFVLCCFHLSFLLTLIKTSPPPWVPTTARPICYSNSFFFLSCLSRLSPAAHTCCIFTA